MVKSAVVLSDMPPRKVKVSVSFNPVVTVDDNTPRTPLPNPVVEWSNVPGLPSMNPTMCFLISSRPNGVVR
jgi:hypothetical protein